MKTMFVAVAALMMLAACGAPTSEGGCADCEKMAREANAQHKAEMAKHGPDCECCKKGDAKHAH